jgi:hypothetical protein
MALAGSVRKRKVMIKKLGSFFNNLGYIPTETEYKALPEVPYRLAIINKYIGVWPRVVAHVERYYPITSNESFTYEAKIVATPQPTAPTKISEEEIHEPTIKVEPAKPTFKPKVKEDE